MPRHSPRIIEDSLSANLAALSTFWNRYYFHDLSVKSIHRTSGRVIVIIDEYILILTGVEKFRQEIGGFSTPWMKHSLEVHAKSAHLKVELEDGDFECVFSNLRLIQNQNYEVLIPLIDPGYN